MKSIKDGLLDLMADSGVFCSERKLPDKGETMANMPKDDTGILDLCTGGTAGGQGGMFSVGEDPAKAGYAVSSIGIQYDDSSISRKLEPRLQYQEPEMVVYKTPMGSSMMECDLTYFDKMTRQNVIITVKVSGKPALDSVIQSVKKAIEHSC